MKSLIALFLLATGLSACQKSGPSRDCIDPSRISNNACTLQYDPVCGCNGVTYGNECEAGRAGVTSWTRGKCP